MKHRLTFIVLTIAMAIAAMYPHEANAQVKNMPVVCMKASSEGKFVGDCNAGTTAATGHNEYYAPALPDTLVRWCSPLPTGCSWDDQKFRYVKFRDVPAGALVDVCEDTITPWVRDPFPWDFSTSACKNWKGIPKEQVATLPLATGGDRSAAKFTWDRAKWSDNNVITDAHSYKILRRRSNVPGGDLSKMETVASAVPAPANTPTKFSFTAANQANIRCYVLVTVTQDGQQSPPTNEVCKQFGPAAPTNGSIAAPTDGSITVR